MPWFRQQWLWSDAVGVTALALVLLPSREYAWVFEVWRKEDKWNVAKGESEDILKHGTHHVLHLKLNGHHFPVVISSRQIQADDSMKRKNGDYKIMWGLKPIIESLKNILPSTGCTLERATSPCRTTLAVSRKVSIAASNSDALSIDLTSNWTDFSIASSFSK